jgi:hypothetical protein
MKKTIILLFALLIMAGFGGCQKVKRIFVKPPLGDVTQESYSIKVYAYDSSVVVKEKPQRLMGHFADFSGIEKSSGILQIELADSSLGRNITEVGQYIDVNLKLLGFEFPCRVICIRFKQDEDIWLLVLTEGTWALLRFEFEEIPEGSMVNLNVTGSPSKPLAALIDNFPLIEATAHQLDLIMALIQTEFDPELDTKQLTEKGIRGEAYEEFLQAYECSIWINALPENLIAHVLEPDNMQKILDVGQVEGMAECIYEQENRRLWANEEGVPFFCPIIVKLAGFEWKADTFLIINPNNPQDFLTIYGAASVADIVFKEQLVAQPEEGGARARMIVVVEPPGHATPNIMDMFISISGVPKWIEKLLLDIKAKVEGIG